MATKNKYMEDYVAIVIEKKRAEGCHVAFWQGHQQTNPANMWQSSKPIYYRMAGHNSSVFRPNYLNGDFDAWIENPIIIMYRIPKTGAEYKQDMNWGLRLVAPKKPGDGSVNSKAGYGPQPPGDWYPKPHVEKQGALIKKVWKMLSFGPRPGAESKLTPAQKLELEILQVRKGRELRVYDAHRREIEAVYNQDCRRIKVGGEWEETLRFMEGDWLRIKDQVGPAPHKGK